MFNRFKSFMFVIGLVLITSLNCAEGQKIEEYNVDADNKFSFTLTDINGNVRKFEDLRGKGVIINVWATWCGPCLKEMPIINDLYNKYKDQGIEVWGIATDIQGIDIVQPEVDRMKIDYPIFVYQEAELTKIFDYFRGRPTTFFFDTTGEVVQRLDGEPFVDKENGETLESWWEKKMKELMPK